MNVVKMILLPFVENDLFLLTLIFCFIAAFILIACSIFYTVLLKNKFYIEMADFNLKKNDGGAGPTHRREQLSSSVVLLEEMEIEVEKQKWTDKLDQIQGSKTMLFSVFFCFLVTFAIFPGFFLMMSFSFTETNFPWHLILCLSLFNGFDMTGRILGANYHLPERAIFIMSVIRVSFVASTILIIIFNDDISDWIKFLNIILFAVSNGYTSTQCAIKAPAYAMDKYK